MKKLWLTLGLLLLAVPTAAQTSKTGRITEGAAAPPSTCTVGDLYFRTTTSVGLYHCTATNTWTGPPGASSFTVTGDITANSFITSGAGTAYTQWATSAFGVGSAGTVRCGAFTGNVFACSGNGGTVTALPFLAGHIGGTQASPTVIGLGLTGEGYTGNQGLTFTCTNDTTTGTTNALLAVQTSTGCLKATTGNTNVPVYITYSGGAITGSSHQAYGGIVPCVMDATTSNTQGFYVIASVTTAGRCHAQSAQPTGVYVVGVLNDNSTTTGSNANVQVGGPYSLGVRTIASGTSALGTGSISATTCATVVTTSATGAVSTDTIDWAFNAAPSTGYTSGVHVLAYVTTDNVNFLVCNPTAGALTPAAATLNWQVRR